MLGLNVSSNVQEKKGDLTDQLRFQATSSKFSKGTLGHINWYVKGCQHVNLFRTKYTLSIFSLVSKTNLTPTEKGMHVQVSTLYYDISSIFNTV